MIKQSLQLRIGQQLSMTPQLQQAIRLLQLSTLDLQQEIQAALDSNPLLELVEEGNDTPADARLESGDFEPDDSGFELPPAASASTAASEAPAGEAADDWQGDTLPDDLPVDTDWESLFESGGTGEPASGHDPDEVLAQTHSARESLCDHLLWQLNLTPLSERDRLMALTLIDSIGPSGLLSEPFAEIADSLRGELADFDDDELEAVLHQIQNFDPPGVGARDLRECLLIQLRQLPADTPLLAEAMSLVSEDLALLGSQDLRTLTRKTGLDEAQLTGILHLLRRLNPSPGDALGENDTEYIVPDVFVHKVNRRWLVELNPDIAPRIRINAHYASLIRRADNSSDNTFLRNNLQEARWFIKSLRSRNETLLRVASTIVELQQGFLEEGEEAMKPLVLADIASALELHESTISRATTRKYMHTPRGIFELKYFFSSHVSNADGGEHSATAIRALIRKLIAAENPRRPLSDSHITELLAAQGIEVARRTVAKYRESLHIGSSSERKRLV